MLSREHVDVDRTMLCHITRLWKVFECTKSDLYCELSSKGNGKGCTTCFVFCHKSPFSSLICHPSLRNLSDAEFDHEYLPWEIDTNVAIFREGNIHLIS